MDLEKAITGRRAIRKYTAREVEEEKILAILEAGRWAPYGNLRPWEAVLIKDKTILKKIWKVSPGGFGDASCAIVLCVDKHKASETAGLVGKDFCSIADPSFAAQNMLLTAYSLGLGSCPIISFAKQALKILLEIPDNVDPVYIVTMGYTDQVPSPPPRPALEEILFLDKYGNRYLRQEKT